MLFTCVRKAKRMTDELGNDFTIMNSEFLTRVLNADYELMLKI